ncbi:NAD(P)-dependent oxidoreductase [Rhabdobacter roseus]|uniref:3-hydroxyisobutyrate dehydrogenase-like beta-hydroxyacid dehydrogenase n=1 Tax=Rhabdobacter roseus TaxID=1655419 RepID=A0A840TND9_9BACT|nr:NAD(P)-dependent oxidoreductase [Rhabdobacter roseus]MBB5284874.1 3-hydroxyisobutyrate dehydrogenase-like beta-hydroxyacid dehydrogenase [Rhabdobacter roseus]
MSEQIAFLGLGSLGTPIAGNLLKDGHTLTVWNRTSGKAQALLDQGAREASSALEAVTPGGVVVSVLADDAAVEEVLSDEVLARLGEGSLHISMSTISASTARRLAERHEAHGVKYLAAPIFARPDAVSSRIGNLCVSGSAAAKERGEPILRPLVKGYFDFGEDAGAANVVKLAGNFMIAATIEMAAEAFTLGEKQGVPRQAMYDLFSQTLFAAPIFQNYGRMVAQHTYEPVGFRLPLGLKDINLTLQTAAEGQVPMPLASLLRDRLLSAIAKGRSDLDWTGFALGASDDAGL